MKNKLLKNLMLPVFLLLGSFIYAQSVTGNVSDTSGALPGVNVLIKGTTTGTQTDFDGNYTLDDVASDAVIVYSFVGYKTQEITVNGQSVINVLMEEDFALLDEIIVIGYGTTTIKDATGSVSSVSSKDFNGGIISSPEQLIQGKTAGVQITQSSGEPGAGIDIRIRGSNSIRSNNNPLFVIDGIPVSGDSTSPGSGNVLNGGGDSRNPLSFLNPSDIESISILKDASSTAIYGSRGANGVVIITTKNGRGSKGGVWEYSQNFSVSNPAENLDLLNRAEFLEGVALVTGSSAAAVQGDADTNWQDVITRGTGSIDTNLAYSNNYGDGNVRATFGYSDQLGVIEKTGQERITGRLNASHRFFDDKLKIGLQASISRVNDEASPTTSEAGFRGNILGAAYSANPTWPNDPNFFFAGSQINPANYLENFQSLTNTERYLFNLSTEYNFTPELSAKVNLGYDESEGENTTVITGLINNFNRVPGNGQGSFGTINVVNRLLEATVRYNKQFENSSLDVLAGYSYQEFKRSGFNSQGWGFSGNDKNGMGNQLRASVATVRNNMSDFDQLGFVQQAGYDDGSSFVNILDLTNDVPISTEVLSQTGTVKSLWVDRFKTTDELQSFFARVNYTLKDKYLFTATIRADGSSKFGDDNSYGYFPSAAFAWKLHEEDFIGDAFSTLKIRLGAGITGNQEGLGFAEFLQRQRFAGPGISDAGTVSRPGIDIVANQNADLKWEETLDFNFGIDFGFNNDRFSGTIEVYRKETEDLLFRSNAGAPSNTPFTFKNLEDAKIVNTGFEITLNYDFIQTEDFNFSASLNVSYVDNEVQDFVGTVDLSRLRGPGLSGGFAQRLVEGRSLFSFYLAEFTGFDSNGNPTYEDVNGDGVQDVFQDRKFVGKDALPDVTAGLSLNFNYKNFDLSAFFTGQFGFSVYNNTANAFSNTDILAQARNATRNVLNAAREGINITSAPSTFFLEDGDFVRLQSASIGYNVPVSGDYFFDSLRVSLTGQNLFIITDYSGLDPEVRSSTGDIAGTGIPSAGIDYTSFPKPRTITFGINARF